MDGRQFFVELHERDVRGPLVRLVEDVGRVDHGGAAQRARDFDERERRIIGLYQGLLRRGLRE